MMIMAACSLHKHSCKFKKNKIYIGLMIWFCWYLSEEVDCFFSVPMRARQTKRE